MADFFIARAPRPTILLGQRNDFFDPRGLVETFEEVRKIYALLGAEHSIEHFIGPDAHGYHQKNREAMYTFFSKHAAMPSIDKEGEVKLEDERNLRCTAQGQVTLSQQNSRKVFDFTKEKAAALKSSRQKRPAIDLNASVRSLLNLSPVGEAPAYYRKLKPIDQQEFVTSRFAVETEPGIQAILFSLSPKQENDPVKLFLDAGKAANLYIPHLASRDDINNKAFDFTAADRRAYTLDHRGIGETMPLTCGMQDFFTPYDSDYFYGCVGNMLGSPYLGGKVFDVLQVVNLLKQNGYDDIHLVGRGLGAIVCAFAAFLSADVSKVTLKNALLSYHELTQTSSYKWPFSHMLHGVLRHFDLPDLYDALAPKNLTIIDPWDEKMEVWEKAKCLSHAQEIGLNPEVIRFPQG